ncbi:hypothetical protein TSO221_01810 [Azospirillum sp. TSO22-1]|nr:hypothetical protein TSO221_01810 [Azospirillum sp. TSO22-1]
MALAWAARLSHGLVPRSMYARSHRRAASFAGCRVRRTCQWRFIGTSPISIEIRNRAAPSPRAIAQTQSTPPPAQGEPHRPRQAEFVICDQTIEEVFGWIKTVAGHRKSRFRGTARVGWAFTFATAAYNLIRLPKLLEAPP